VVGTPQRSVLRNDARGDVELERYAETPLQTQGTPRARPPRLNKVESIDEVSPASSFNAAPVEENGVLQSVEQTLPVGDDEDEEMLFSVEEHYKRRRLTPQPQPRQSPPSSPASLLSSPHRQVHTPAPASHRFKPPAPKTPAPFDNHSVTTTSQTTTSKRPQFKLPHSPPSPSKAATPLPETFSPSRKNGKFLPGGLASTLQSWIVETGEAGYSARSKAGSGVIWGKDREDGVKMRVRITQVCGGKNDDDTSVECWAGGVVFVRGTTDAQLYNASRASSVVTQYAHDDGNGDVGGGPAEYGIMLAGQGGARGKAGVRIREGGVIGIRAPMWDVQIGSGGCEEKWIVGVEWVVLS
jgi:hypothetical protein